MENDEKSTYLSFVPYKQTKIYHVRSLLKQKFNYRYCVLQLVDMFESIGKNIVFSNRIPFWPCFCSTMAVFSSKMPQKCRERFHNAHKSYSSYSNMFGQAVKHHLQWYVSSKHIRSPSPPLSVRRIQSKKYAFLPPKAQNSRIEHPSKKRTKVAISLVRLKFYLILGHA